MFVNPLSSENLVLRQFESTDVQQFVNAVRESAATVGEWLPWWKADFSEHDAMSWFQCCNDASESQAGYDIGVFEKASGSLIGSVALNRIDKANRLGSLGYWVRESEQGKGYCSEAVRRMTTFGFDELGLARLNIVVLVDNVASRKVAEKCGAKLECIAENRLVHRGRPSAAAVYSLIHDGVEQ